MNEPATPVRRRWIALKVTAAVLAFLVISALLTYNGFRVAGNRRFAEMEALLPKLEAEIAARDAFRPPLRGPGTPGNAWDDYRLAFNEVDTFKSRVDALGEFVHRSPRADRTGVLALLAEHPEMLYHVRRGASRNSSKLLLCWEDGFFPMTWEWRHPYAIVHFSICRSRFLIEEGQFREAAEVLLDACQFALDLGRNTTSGKLILGLSYVVYLQGDLMGMILSRSIPPEDLEKVAHELDVLEESFPSLSLSLSNDPLQSGHQLIEVERTSTHILPTTEYYWKYQEDTLPLQKRILQLERFGGLRRLMYAGLFDWQRSAVMQLQCLDTLPWPDLQRLQKRLHAEAQGSRNPLVRLIAREPEGDAIRYLRLPKTQLNLLRLASRFRLTGVVPEIDDPFGTKLRTVRTGDHLKAWSLGRDGIDQGGVGDWKGAPTGDIVLEVDR